MPTITVTDRRRDTAPDVAPTSDLPSSIRTDETETFLAGLTHGIQCRGPEAFVAICRKVGGSLYPFGERTRDPADGIARYTYREPAAWTTGGLYDATALRPGARPDGKPSFGGKLCRGRTRANLLAVHTLVVDCDLKSFLAAQDPDPSLSFAQRQAAIETAIHAMDRGPLDEILARHLEALRDVLKRLELDDLPVPIVCSGYGLYPLFQVAADDIHRLEDAEKLQRALVRAFNAEAGYPFADPGASDAGTRAFRLVGSWNLKDPSRPRAVRMYRGVMGRRIALDDLLERLAAHLDDPRPVAIPVPVALPSLARADVPALLDAFPGLIAPYWGSGANWKRHEFMWAVSTELAKAQIPLEDAVRVLTETARLAGDTEYCGGLAEKRTAEAYRQLAGGHRTKGLATLVRDLLDAEGAMKLTSFLHALRGSPEPAVSPATEVDDEYGEINTHDAIYSRAKVVRAMTEAGVPRIAHALSSCLAPGDTKVYYCDEHGETRRLRCCHSELACIVCARSAARRDARDLALHFGASVLVLRVRVEGAEPSAVVDGLFEATSKAMGAFRHLPALKVIRTGHAELHADPDRPSRIDADILIDIGAAPIAPVLRRVERLAGTWAAEVRRADLGDLVATTPVRTLTYSEVPHDAVEPLISDGLSHVSPWVMDDILIGRLLKGFKGRKRHRSNKLLQARVDAAAAEAGVQVGGDDETPTIKCPFPGCGCRARLSHYLINLDEVRTLPPWRAVGILRGAAERSRAHSRGQSRFDVVVEEGGVVTADGWGRLETLADEIERSMRPYATASP